MKVTSIRRDVIASEYTETIVPHTRRVYATCIFQLCYLCEITTINPR